jgi:hypothetical protein
MGKNKIKPYEDILISDNTKIRVFDENIDPIELKWHRDLVNRKVTVLEGQGWYFQKDNELPFELKEGVSIFIEASQWHRVIKGKTPLKIKIYE